MARNKSVSSTQVIGLPTSYTFPHLHQKVSSALSDEISSTWFKGQEGGNFNNEYSTYVMGKFKCNNNMCSKNGWGSKRVAIRIRGYPNNGYDAVVFNQRCESCDQLGVLTLDETSYVERVSYRIKKWAGVPVYNGHHDDSKEGPPHKSELCEGCKQGLDVLQEIQTIPEKCNQSAHCPNPARLTAARWSSRLPRTRWEEGMDDFLPECWIDEDGKYNPKRFPRLAFSAGPRVCYGQRLALQELYITLTLLVLVFEFEAVPDELSTMGGLQRVLRVPEKSYIRLSAL